eukprot:CAMPEP_0113845354 /NCGR_PEP_ID=MMETSP0372-20130328/712_1 /TAXON_ID=340204 /ORGANISM="Lankesteria abbotti" /LENGTH=85 /DNA_ID=CAMNT_0000814391 /DNA_START=605 /DNA_END=862 /DNA_ORIENTATION=+ /assembly_acc=CAM_ASM_000359
MYVSLRRPSVWLANVEASRLMPDAWPDRLQDGERYGGRDELKEELLKMREEMKELRAQQEELVLTRPESDLQFNMTRQFENVVKT